MSADLDTLSSDLRTKFAALHGVLAFETSLLASLTGSSDWVLTLVAHREKDHLKVQYEVKGGSAQAVIEEMIRRVDAEAHEHLAKLREVFSP